MQKLQLTSNNNKIYLPWIVAGGFLLIYLLFPSHNSSIDSVAYAADMKYGEELFVPHHLFYNLTGFIFLQILHWVGINTDALATIKVLNAFAAFSCLLFFHFILKEMKLDPVVRSGYVFIAAASFGFWRFAVENEVYILPLLFSLASTLLYIRYFHHKIIKDLVLAGLWGAIACLFHQIHFFWWFGMLAGLLFFDRKIKTVIYYFLPALLVPLIYCLVIVFYHGISLSPFSFIHYIFSDYYSGKVVRHVGTENFVMEIISLARTFFQLHGNIPLIFSRYHTFLKVSSLFLISGLLFFLIKNLIPGIKKLKGEQLIYKTFYWFFSFNSFLRFSQSEMPNSW